MKVCLQLCLFLMLIGVQAKASLKDHPWRKEDAHPGYAEDLQPANEEVGEIMYSVDNPYRNDIKLSERMFDPTLKKDITTRYHEQFGRTEAEIIQTRTPYLNSNFSEGASITFNEEEYQKQQQKFGNYIAKRLVEYHFEKEAKDNPDLRGVYEAKQTLENASASVGKIKIRARYRIASNSILTYIKNPWVNLEARFEMSGGSESVYSLGKDLGKGYSFVTDYYPSQPRWDIIGRKMMTAALSFTLTYSPFRHITYEEKGVTYAMDEKIILAGLGYVF